VCVCVCVSLTTVLAKTYYYYYYYYYYVIYNTIIVNYTEVPDSANRRLTRRLNMDAAADHGAAHKFDFPDKFAARTRKPEPGDTTQSRRSQQLQL